MDESKSNTSYDSEESENTGSTEYEGNLVEGEVTPNFFKYTSAHKPVHVKICKSTSSTESLKTEQCRKDKNKWKIRVRLEPKLSKNSFVQNIRKR